MKVRNTKESEKIELQMTPMIDIVFQLLIFFIMTFKIVAMEGDFSVNMPAAGAPEDTPDIIEKTTLTVRMTADANGTLSKLTLNNQDLSRSFAALHARVLEMVGPQSGPAGGAMFEVEFDCDYGLNYKYVIEAITAVSGQVTGSGSERQVVKLIEQIKFSPIRKEG